MFDKMVEKIGRSYDGEIIPRRTKWIYTTSGLGRDAVYAMVSVFLITFITKAGYLEGNYNAMFATISGIIIGYRLFDAINDPFMGVVIEKCHFKTGKYKPWIFLGSFTNTATVLALFLTPAFCTWCRGWGFVAWFAVFYLLWGMTFTMNDIAFCSMLPSMSSNERQRTRVTSLLMIFENGGSFMISLLVPFMAQSSLGVQNAYWIAAIIISALFVIGQTALFFFCPEHKRNLKEEAKAEPPRFKDMLSIFKKNRLVRIMVIVILIWFISIFSLEGLMQDIFFLSVGYDAGFKLMSWFSFVKIGAIVIPMLFMPRILDKVPKMKVFKICMGTLIVSCFIFFIYGAPLGGTSFIAPSFNFGTVDPAYTAILFLIALIMYVANSCTYNVIYLFMENTVEYNEYISGRRQESVIFSMRPFATKFASSIQILITDAAMYSTGYIAVSEAINNNNNNYDPEEAERLNEIVIRDALNNTGMIYGMRVWGILVPAVLLIVTFFLLVKFYDLTDEKYKSICKEISKRKRA